jgi:hypothetical protein
MLLSSVHTDPVESLTSAAIPYVTPPSRMRPSEMRYGACSGLIRGRAIRTPVIVVVSAMTRSNTTGDNPGMVL